MAGHHHGMGDPEGGAKVSGAFDGRLLSRLWFFIRPHRRLIWLGLLMLLLGNACRLALPWVIKVVIDEHLLPGRLEGFQGLAGIFIAIAGIEFFVRRAQLYTVDTAGQNALYDLRIALFRHLQRLSSSFYDRTPIGRLVGRVTTDIEALQEMFSSGVVTVFADLIFLTGVFCILIYSDAELTLVTMSIVPVLLVLTLVVRVRVRSAYGLMRSKLSHLNAFLHEHIVGMPLVQMFRRQRATRAEFGEINDVLRDAQIRSVRWESTLSAGMEMLSSFTYALILWYGGGLLLEGASGGAASLTTSGLTLGTLFAFIQWMERFFGPLNELSLKYTVMQNAMTASSRIFGLLDEDERIPEPETPVRAPRTAGAIQFQNVLFGYDPEQPVLRDVSFKLEPGERLAIVGATGSGKTTILKLLTRLYDIQQGAILLDGIDVRRYALGDLRSRIAVVPQDGFLFEGDILENIRLGHPEISDAQAIAAADRLHLDEIVARFPAGYREGVAERGKNLSAGEKQLIAFARVLAVAPRVLVLDEATSNVDTHTEHLLQQAVHELMLGRTSLIVAHRLSTIRDVDRILVMHKGQLVEEGSHEALMRQRGVYWRLYQLQYQAQESQLGESRSA